MPQVTVEFFGVPRLKAGIDRIELQAETVADLLQRLIDEVPTFAASCLAEGQLSKEYLLNLNGNIFTRDASQILKEGDEVLILSADVGG